MSCLVHYFGLNVHHIQKIQLHKPPNDINVKFWSPTISKFQTTQISCAPLLLVALLTFPEISPIIISPRDFLREILLHTFNTEIVLPSFNFSPECGPQAVPVVHSTLTAGSIVLLPCKGCVSLDLTHSVMPISLPPHAPKFAGWVEP